MARTPFELVQEEGEDPQTLVPLPPELQPRDYTILGKLFEGKKPPQIAKEMRLHTRGITQIINSPPFKALVQQVERVYLDKIGRGEFGAMAMAKAETEKAMGRIIKISKLAEDDKVRLTANLEVLKFGGIQQPKPQVTENVERLIDQMTAEEAEEFAVNRVWPDRFKDQLARLATSAIQKSEEKRWGVDVEVLEEEKAPKLPQVEIKEEEEE